jgi:hypothetical protein
LSWFYPPMSNLQFPSKNDRYFWIHLASLDSHPQVLFAPQGLGAPHRLHAPQGLGAPQWLGAPQGLHAPQGVCAPRRVWVIANIRKTCLVRLG